jgi:hypothetical protein
MQELARDPHRFAPDHAFLIGARNTGGWGWLEDGLIDEVAIYGRALSQPEVSAHYKAATDRDCPPP